MDGWSPQEDRIVFQDNSGALLTMDTTGGSLDTLVKLDGTAATPRWSPDGNTVAFSFAATGSSFSNIWLVDVNTRQTLQLTSVGTVSHPAWSSDGTQIAFHGIVNSAGNTQIFMMRKDGSGVINVTKLSQARGAIAPDWASMPPP